MITSETNDACTSSENATNEPAERERAWFKVHSDAFQYQLTIDKDTLSVPFLPDLVVPVVIVERSHAGENIVRKTALLEPKLAEGASYLCRALPFVVERVFYIPREVTSVRIGDWG